MGYYSDKNTGGSAMSRGINYQDLCAIRLFFEYVDNEEFISLTLEQIDDFSILLKEKEIYVEVKSYKVGCAEIKNIVKRSSIDTVEAKYVVVAPNWSESFKSILQKIKEFRNACNSGRSGKQLETIEQELRNIVHSKGLEYEKVINYEFIEYAREDQEEMILYIIDKWLRTNRYTFDESIILDQLGAIIKKNRASRGYLNRETILNLCKKSNFKKDQEYLGKNISLHKEIILSNLYMEKDKNVYAEKDFEILINYILLEDYEKAIDKIDEINNNCRGNFDIYRCWLMLSLGKYQKAKEICDTLLKENCIDLYELIYFYKGVIAFKIKKYIKAYKYLKKSLQLQIKNGNPTIVFEKALYLSKTEIILKKDLEEARQLLLECIFIADDNPELYLELSKISESSKAIELLYRAIDLDEKNEEAYLMLAERYRVLGKNRSAYREYVKYFSNIKNIKNWKALQGFLFCLLNIGKMGEAESYILMYLDNFIHSKYNNLKDHQSMIIMDIEWEGVHLLTCKKENNNYIFSTPLGMIVVPVKETGKSIKNGIGVKPDSLMYMCEMIKYEVNHDELSIENIWKPILIATYSDDLYFLRLKNDLLKTGFLHNNHDWKEKINHVDIPDLFEGLRNGDQLHYQEYIVDEEYVDIKIYEYNKYVQAVTALGNVKFNSTFEKGEGYFNFKKLLSKRMLCSWILYSINRKEMIELTIPSERVNIEYC